MMEFSSLMKPHSAGDFGRIKSGRSAAFTSFFKSLQILQFALRLPAGSVASKRHAAGC